MRNPTVTWHVDSVKVLAPLAKQSHAQAEHSSLDSSETSCDDAGSDMTTSSDQSTSILQRYKKKSQSKRSK